MTAGTVMSSKYTREISLLKSINEYAALTL